MNHEYLSIDRISFDGNADLLRSSSDCGLQWQTFSLRQLLGEVEASVVPRLREQRVCPVFDVAEGQMITADREMLRQAVLNLVCNALDAMPCGGMLVVTSVEMLDAVELEVADSGPGLRKDTLSRVFDAVFTTKQSGKGLEWALVARIAEAHGGVLIAANCPEGGAAFTLRIPRRGHSVEETDLVREIEESAGELSAGHGKP